MYMFLFKVIPAVENIFMFPLNQSNFGIHFPAVSLYHIF